MYSATSSNSTVESAPHSYIYRGADQAAEKVVPQLLTQRSISSSNCTRSYSLPHTQPGQMRIIGAAGTSKICHGSLTALINSWSLIHSAQSCSAAIKQTSSLSHRRKDPVWGFSQRFSSPVHSFTLLMPEKHFQPSAQAPPPPFFKKVCHCCNIYGRSCQRTKSLFPASSCNSAEILVTSNYELPATKPVLACTLGVNARTESLQTWRKRYDVFTKDRSM